MSSTLRGLEDLVLNVTDLDETKIKLSEQIKLTTIRPQDKIKMARNISSCDTVVKLQRYFYNSLLKFENLGTIGFLPR